MLQSTTPVMAFAIQAAVLINDAVFQLRLITALLVYLKVDTSFFGILWNIVVELIRFLYFIIDIKKCTYNVDTLAPEIV